ncbi:unnamed protein product [Prunus armeniaca]|uniref:Uncharacterized protein n=1 Tax=Prunus armeniaca TaxID=36596 RepID=A0A6J5V8X9_PRUAR|nr:unnamed protein product [Prunus armeniaca]
MDEQGGAPQSPLPLPEFDDATIGNWASHLPDVAGVVEVIERRKTFQEFRGQTTLNWRNINFRE